MVEREAQVPGDRAKIAAVIYNRLREGIPLGIDATIYYAVELRSGIATYTQELTEAQLHINSPYNTRTHTGLPPTPISNPGAGLDRGGGAPGARCPTSTTSRAPTAAASRCSRRSPAAFEAERRRLPRGGRERTAGTRRPARRVMRASASSAGRSPTAAPRRCTTRRSRRWAGGLALPAPARPAGAVRGDDARARGSPASSART